MKRISHLSILGVQALLALQASATWGQPIKQCSLVTLESLALSASYTNISLNTRPSMEVGQAGSEKDAYHLIVLGPILGSMDAQDFSAVLSCTENGFAIESVITRSASYTGSAAKNIYWQPRIDILISLPKRDAVGQIAWKMTSSDGSQPRYPQTPPYTYQPYPITLQAVIRK